MDQPLPGLLGEIEEIVGSAAALKIAQHYGGVRVSIPATLPPDHWLIKTIGKEKAQTLSDYFSVGHPGRHVRSGLYHVIIPQSSTSMFSTLRYNLQALVLVDLQAGIGVRTYWPG